MNEVELNTLIDAWIAHTDAPKDSPQRAENWWAIERVMNWCGHRHANPEALWVFILAACKRDLSTLAEAYLAAGPMESLLVRWGPQYIDRVEDLARNDPRFNHLLGGVWRNEMQKDIWRRVKAVRHEVW